MSYDVKSIFPYDELRKEQVIAVEFALNSFINEGKKFVIIEAGTGVGKSAIGLTVSRYLDLHHKDPDYNPGGYFLTTQKILQEQYVKDFGKPQGSMCSIKSSSNYQCTFDRKNNFFSARRSLKLNLNDYGRNISIIMIN